MSDVVERLVKGRAAERIVLNRTAAPVGLADFDGIALLQVAVGAGVADGAVVDQRYGYLFSIRIDGQVIVSISEMERESNVARGVA